MKNITEAKKLVPGWIVDPSGILLDALKAIWLLLRNFSDFEKKMSENFTCYLCRNNEFSIVVNADSMRLNCYGFNKKILRCNECGLIQLHPQWTNDQLKSLYSDFHQKQIFEGYKPKETIALYLTKYIKRSDKILEVGCGLGYEIKRLNQKGYDIIGIDKDPEVCDNKLIFNSDFQDFNTGRGEKFDFIYAINLFEHLPDPKKFIAWLVKNLRENGRFLLEIPDIDNPLLKLFKNKSFHEFYWDPYHLFFYDRNLIKNLLKDFSNLAFRIIPLQKYGLINHSRWIIFGKPGNINFHLPILDDVYKFILVNLFRVNDSLIIQGRKKKFTEGIRKKQIDFDSICKEKFGGKVLDIGCGAGIFLQEMKKAGWKVRGVECDKNCHEYANNVLRISVERCLFRDFNTDEKFDLIYFSHSLDDLPNLNDVLIRVRNLLNPGGKLFIEVSNFNSDTNFNRVQDGDFLVNQYYFTPASLSKLLRKHCFSILYLKTEEPVYLNTFGQYLLSPIRIMKKLIPADRKSHIQVVAEVMNEKLNLRESNSSFYLQAF